MNKNPNSSSNTLSIKRISASFLVENFKLADRTFARMIAIEDYSFWKRCQQNIKKTSVYTGKLLNFFHFLKY